MEEIKKYLIGKYEGNPEVEGLVLMHNTEQFPFHTIEYTYYVLIISSQLLTARKIEHLEIQQERVYLMTVDISDIENPLISTVRYHLMDWFVSGEVFYDRQGKIQRMKEKILQFPISIRKQQKFKEYVGFLDKLFHAKRNLTENNVLDAYSQVLVAIHHWAHIVLIEKGMHPELTVWKQLRKVHPGVYKLYEELISSPETVKQRVELAILASEFSVMSKMKACCTFLLELMAENTGPWSIEEIQAHKQLTYIDEDLTLVIQKLVQAQLLKEVAIFNNENLDEVIELRYILNT